MHAAKRGYRPRKQAAMDMPSPPLAHSSAATPAGGRWLPALRAATALARYLGAVTLFGLALGSRFVVADFLPTQGYPFLTFFPAVMLSAWLAGLGPGLACAALSIAGAWFYFIPPAQAFLPLSRADTVALVLFSAVLLIDCVILHVMNQALASRIRAEAALREADRQKDTFLATLSHELRNPLAPIRAAAHVIRLSEQSDERVRNATAVIERQAAQLARLVDDLLDVSRLTFGRLKLQREVVDLRMVVDSAIETSRPMIQARGHDFSLRLPAHPVMVEADVTRVAQCVSNLLNNACKFTPAPGGRVSVVLEAAPAGNACIRVQDNGHGIAPHMRARVFELFEQERRNGLHGNTGLGIGLALTRRLVEMHGGTVSVRSDGEGCGAEFEILLPLNAQPEPRPYEAPMRSNCHVSPP